MAKYSEFHVGVFFIKVKENIRDSEKLKEEKNYYTILNENEEKSDENMRDVRGGVLAVATGNLAKRPTNLLFSKL